MAPPWRTAHHYSDMEWYFDGPPPSSSGGCCTVGMFGVCTHLLYALGAVPQLVLGVAWVAVMAALAVPWAVLVVVGWVLTLGRVDVRDRLEGFRDLALGFAPVAAFSACWGRVFRLGWPFGCLLSDRDRGVRARFEEEASANEKITAQSKRDKRAAEHRFPMLLLGDPDGQAFLTSVFLLDDYTRGELAEFGSSIRRRAIRLLQVAARRQEPQGCADAVATVLSKEGGGAWDEDLRTAIKKLLVSLPHDCLCDNGALHEWLGSDGDRVDRVGSADYRPGRFDMVALKQLESTIAVSECSFRMSGFELVLVQLPRRTDTRKILDQFAEVQAVVYCVDVSTYEENLPEDETQLKLREAMYEFDSLVNSRWLSRKAVILFLTGMDKLDGKTAPLTVCFPEYTGDSTREAKLSYIRDRFRSVDRQPGDRQVYVMNRADSSPRRLIFDIVRDIIIRANLATAGF